ncbi:cytochrome c biogenesis CcdA family protein [Plantactinospora sp. KBS50]|uniref:cytochrome c biogenesis CcdA family protein n=1 Tax=Plantactinospora sp. KBS50 TaxID=2024580 RepID=UPI000BAAC8D8|nr:cytochrome c biogenesis protein CcdA [Plantactinospora sp. KBS50]ASW53180.1 cytochrome C biogenesis protein [Plantactinospora sp. KBS50]
MGAAFADLARSGPLLLAVGAAALAGLVSFLSPCVLPLVPGYLSYVTGLAGTDLERGATDLDRGGAGKVSRPVMVAPSRAVRSVKGRVLAGTLLFIAGFTAVYLLTAILLAGIGQAMLMHRRALEVVVGAVIMVLGVAFLGFIPGLQREFRLHRLPAAGLLGAPVFGAVFALSWAPCTGPTLGAVLGLATVGGQTDRAAVLAVAYCLGLGLPFMIFGLGFSRLLGLFRAIRRNSRWVTRLGGALLIIVGLALVTGGWQDFIIWLQTTVGPGEVGI